MDERRKKLFLWGILLAWLPFVPDILNAFKGITAQKATGLGAVAGGVAQSLFWFGLVVTVVSDRRDRSVAEGIFPRTLGFSVLMLFFLWMFLFRWSHMS